MTEISKTSQLAAIIRSQMISLTRIDTNNSQKSSAKNAAKKKTEAPKKQPDLAERIALKVKQISEDDPDATRKAFRIFLENVLLAELGQNLINDPRFYEMLNAIQGQMQEDPELASAIDQAMAILLQNAAN